MAKLVPAVLFLVMTGGVPGAQEFVKPDTPPVVVCTTPPVYTGEAAAAKIEGEVHFARSGRER